jgi:hypothetical protein
MIGFYSIKLNKLIIKTLKNIEKINIKNIAINLHLICLKIIKYKSLYINYKIGIHNFKPLKKEYHSNLITKNVVLFINHFYNLVLLRKF